MTPDAHNVYDFSSMRGHSTQLFQITEYHAYITYHSDRL